MSNKQSSIEWLFEQIARRQGSIFQTIPFYNDNYDLIQQAKEMHKQEIYATFAYAYKLGYIDDGDNRIEYYNKQFGSPNKL